ncbi:MAG: outer membrane lipoprotein chaperone LolA [Pseudomonadota bacterium]
MNKFARTALVLSLGCAASAAQAADTALDGYLAGLSTWSANFTQKVEDARGKSAPSGHGKLVIVRPGKLRWESAPDGASDSAQLLIADGKNLWFLDKDLDQATVKPLAQASPQSPAMLLAGGAELRAAFNVQDGGKRDGLDWVRATPKEAASDFREALFGFKGKELARLVIVDKLGQRSTLSFTEVKRNAPVEAGATEFHLPQGVDLIGKPVAP